MTRTTLSAARVSFALIIAAAIGLAGLALNGPLLADGHQDAASESDVVIESDMALPADAAWKHSFDVYKAEAGEENRVLATALRFAKAMEDEGIAQERVKLGLVIHGPSVFDVASDARYAAKHDAGSTAYETNPNAAVVAELVERGAEIWVCGVAAKYHKVGNADLLPGVKMAPSGTVAHAELQRRGFGMNPY